ncbi:MAG: CHAT domain-containing protein [Planctomycetes bacterium]|nr:CHAT domain-containing protein [Planctomycetota bacterium]
MRRTFVATAILLALSVTARAEDAPPSPPVAPTPSPVPAAPSPPKPAPPPTPEQAADGVLAAVTAKDDVALKALAAKDAPDPWLVADELIRRGEFDVADAFAKAAPRVDTEALPGYVASRRGKPDDPARRERLASASAALAAGKPAQMLEALGPAKPEPIDDVVGVRLTAGRASALGRLARHEEAAAAFAAAGETARRMGWLARATEVLHGAGAAHARRAAHEAALASWAQALSLAERRGSRWWVNALLDRIGGAHAALGDHATALGFRERALAGFEALGDRAATARALGNVGIEHEALGDYEKALAIQERVLTMFEALGDALGAAKTRANLALVLKNLGDVAKARSVAERALAAYQELGEERLAARTLGDIGMIQFALGSHESALALLERALAVQQTLGDRAGAAQTLGNVGMVHHALGNFAQALSADERALAEEEALRDRRGAAITLGNLGVVHQSLGDHVRALEAFERALAAQEALGDRVHAALTLGNLGTARFELGDFAGALSCHERAWAAKEALGDKTGAAATLSNIANVHAALGDDARVLSTYERALAVQEASGDRTGAALTLGNLGVVYERRGDRAKALSFFERELAVEEDLGLRSRAVRTLGNLGVVHSKMGRSATAAALARRAVTAQSSLVRGLSAEEGSTARDPLGFVYDVGGHAAVSLRDAAELAYFLENGRAGALLEGLSAREALASAAVPEALRAEESKARAAETRAVAALRKALDRGDLAATKARRAELQAAQEQVAAVVSRIQREAKAGASIVYPEASTLDEIRATLETDDALVLYALFETDAAALVVEREGARIVALGPRAPIDAAAEAVAEALADDASDPSAALTALADLVVKPLALGEGTKRVLVSPTGLLSYVPFAALMRDRTVAYVPSGTSYRLLREEEALRGEAVLAVGDPDYETKIDERALAVNRGPAGKLVRLPATRDEALAIGTTTLLGADATEAGLRKALAERKRWRAVHLACHGLVNTERPALSSLAITAAGDDDGFLTCLDVFRMKIPSDLVVLSACETGKGKVVKGEGIVGLTRAFMFAGSPRVLCSLWKVDDAATAALMTKFYDLWNPKTGSKGMGTAEALRAAQEHVRGQEKWKHPYYWAAWVLWGLPS